jgi:hypothetical protein
MVDHPYTHVIERRRDRVIENDIECREYLSNQNAIAKRICSYY